MARLRRFFRRNLFGCEARFHRTARAQMSRERARIDSFRAGDIPFPQIFIE